MHRPQPRSKSHVRLTRRPAIVDEFNAALKATAYQKKAVSRLPANEVLDLAITFFSERGYRASRTGRPNQVYVMGGREGALPRVTAEISARSDVGKPGTTLVTMDAAGEKLGPAMAEFHKELRAFRQKSARSEGV
jgi:hypothetical protein